MRMHRIVVLGTALLFLCSCNFWNKPSVQSISAGGKSSGLLDADTPALSVSSGTYTAPQSVTISSDTPGAIIYYTTDGDDPTTSSRVYNGPVQVVTNLTLKAIAVREGFNDSKVAAATYAFPEDYWPSSGLPTPQRSGIPRPEGRRGGFKVLTWAGFKAAVTYTFDDSTATQIAAYPDLQATGVRMTFFITRVWAQNSSIWAQVAADGNEIGNHTYHHCSGDGTACGQGTWSGSIQSEYDGCTEFARQTFGVLNMWTTASPYGDLRYDAVAPTRFFLNRGSQRGHILPLDENVDPFHLPTHTPKTGETAEVLNAYIDAAREGGFWQMYVYHSLQPNVGFYPVDLSEVLSNINYAKAQGDVWIDSMVNVGAYWIGQKAVHHAERIHSPDGVTINWKLPSHFPAGKFLRVTVTGGTLTQNGLILPWNNAGYYEVPLDPGTVTLTR
jgi:peptidoglycan/xylan/chitin deacetylase (PgdA/CDA1 family)